MKIKRKKIIIWLIVLIILGGLVGFGYARYKKSQASDTEYTTVPVVRGNLEQTVSATGTIKPLTTVDLNFSNPGKIVVLNVLKGDKVKSGDILAKQDDTGLQISVQQAQANLASAIATLNKIKAGSSTEDIIVKEKNVAAAQSAYDSAVKKLESLRQKMVSDINTYEEAVKSAQIALKDKETSLIDIKNKYSQNIKNLESSAISSMDGYVFTATESLDVIGKALTNSDALVGQQNSSSVSQRDSKYLSLAENGQEEATDLLSKDKIKIINLKNGSTQYTVSVVLASLINTLNKVNSTLSFTFDALKNTVSTSSYSQSSIDSNKTSISSKQTAIQAALDSLEKIQQNLLDANLEYDSQVNTAQAAVNTAQNNLSTAQINLRAAEANSDLQLSNAESEIDSTLANLNLNKSELIKIKAPARRVDLASQEAQVSQYQAALALTQDNLSKTILVSPLDGIITQVNYEISEQTSAAEPAIVLVSDGNYSIEVDISETDIVKVSNGDNVKVTFDSLGEKDVFNAKVIFIDPAQTIISDVVYYKVKIVIAKSTNSNFDKIKPGMTANIDIMTDYKENVLMVPARAVQSKNGQDYVKILERNGKEVVIKEEKVEVGINGDDGLVEVFNHLKEGQEVITFIKNTNK